MNHYLHILLPSFSVGDLVLCTHPDSVEKTEKQGNQPSCLRVDGEYKKRSYAGRLRMRLIPNRGKIALTKFATENIKTGTTVMTDDWVGYVDLWKWFDHEVVMASR